MTKKQLEVLLMMRKNPNFCRNEQEMQERTVQLRHKLEQVVPRIEQQILALKEVNQTQVVIDQIIREEMQEICQYAVIVKADAHEQALSHLPKNHQIYLAYYFPLNSIEPNMVTIAVAPSGKISFYNPPLLLDILQNRRLGSLCYSQRMSKQLCQILQIPISCLKEQTTSTVKKSSSPVSASDWHIKLKDKKRVA